MFSWLSYVLLSDKNAIGVGHKSVILRPFRSRTNSLIALTIRSGWVSVHKTIQFTSESLVALLIIAKAWWHWWDLATNVSEYVWRFQWLTESPLMYLPHSISGICFRDHVYLLKVRMCHILNLGNMLYRYNHQDQHDHNWFRIFCSVAIHASKLQHHS